MKSAVVSTCIVGLILAAGFAVAPSISSLSGTISVEEARATVVSAQMPVSFGYMTIRNASGEPDRLIAVSTDFAAVSEVHENFIDDGLELMRRLPDGLEIPAGGLKELKADGVHLMFMQISHCLAEGSQTRLVLQFEKAGRVEVDMRMEDDSTAKAHDHQGS